MRLASHHCALLRSIGEAELHALFDVDGVILVIIFDNDLRVVNYFVHVVKEAPIDEDGVNFSISLPFRGTGRLRIFAVIPEPGAVFIMIRGRVLRALLR